MFAATLLYEVPQDIQAIGLSPTLERGDGAIEFGFVRKDGRTSLARLYQRTPCRALFPNTPPEDCLQAVLVTTSGGLAGGDRIAIAVAAGHETAVTVTTQAAEKIYRSLGPHCAIDVSLAVADKAWLEWLPQETILFEEARLVRRSEADVAAGGRLLAAEMLVFGRLARGERFTTGLLHDGWRVRRDGRLIWADALRLDGDVAAALLAPGGFAGAEAVGSVLYVADDAAALLACARELSAKTAARAGATLVNGVLVVRWLGTAPDVRAALTQYLAAFRHAAAGWPAQLPRVWSA